MNQCLLKEGIQDGPSELTIHFPSGHYREVMRPHPMQSPQDAAGQETLKNSVWVSQGKICRTGNAKSADNNLKTSGPEEGLLLMFVDQRKPFDSIPIAAILLNRLDESKIRLESSKLYQIMNELSKWHPKGIRGLRF